MRPLIDGGKIIEVYTGVPYEVHIGRGLLRHTGDAVAQLLRPRTAAVITDDRVDALYAKTVTASLEGAGIKAVKFVFPNGENAKAIETAMEIYSFLSDNGVTRSDCIVALGGGVAGDLAGFVAATFLRGIPFVQLPTTLLAAVDSSVGGKTAVNIPQGKNLVGAFWQPRLVLCDPDTLQTLPRETLCDGAAEALKYGAILDEDLFSRLEGGSLEGQMDEIISRCVAHKRNVVESDEHDTGRRQLLNFGHTLGHAIEKESGFSISHGKAVGVGMALITQRTEALGLTQQGSAQRIRRALDAFGLPSRYDGNLVPLCETMLSDKKRHGDTLSFVILDKIGASRLYPVPVEDVRGFVAGDSEG